MVETHERSQTILLYEVLKYKMLKELWNVDGNE